jgi:hypothetical protein
VVYLSNLILIDNEMFQFVEYSEAGDLVPTFDSVLLKVNISKILPMILVNFILRADLLAIVTNEE